MLHNKYSINIVLFWVMLIFSNNNACAGLLDYFDCQDDEQMKQQICLKLDDGSYETGEETKFTLLKEHADVLFSGTEDDMEDRDYLLNAALHCMDVSLKRFNRIIERCAVWFQHMPLAKDREDILFAIFPGRMSGIKAVDVSSDSDLTDEDVALQLRDAENKVAKFKSLFVAGD